MSLHMRSPLPPLDGAAHWLNGEPATADLEGKPVLVQFWSIGCHICHDTADQVTAWRARFAALGLQFVAIHQPRSPEELDIERVAADAAESMRITQSCAVDNAHTIVDRFENRFVPSFYLFDREHRLRHFQAGDKGYDRIVAAIERVLT